MCHQMESSNSSLTLSRRSRTSFVSRNESGTCFSGQFTTSIPGTGFFVRAPRFRDFCVNKHVAGSNLEANWSKQHMSTVSLAAHHVFLALSSFFHGYRYMVEWFENRDLQSCQARKHLTGYLILICPYFWWSSSLCFVLPAYWVKIAVKYMYGSFFALLLGVKLSVLLVAEVCGYDFCG